MNPVCHLPRDAETYKEAAAMLRLCNGHLKLKAALKLKISWKDSKPSKCKRSETVKQPIQRCTPNGLFPPC